ncbi:hypothetical protein AGMMS49938_09580 [Fibrobacterales bacterium]|nr:hypothetical protein AGMMS49938_09580 [Fibrobacterales bacterium]
MIFPATEKDSAWIADIQVKCGLPIFKTNATTWVIPSVAFAIWQVAGDEAELLSVAVAEEERKKGYGKAILECSMRELAAQGVSKFFLEVREGNTAAIALYQKLGFKKIGVRKNYYSNGENAFNFRRG